MVLLTVMLLVVKRSLAMKIAEVRCRVVVTKKNTRETFLILIRV